MPKYFKNEKEYKELKIIKIYCLNNKLQDKCKRAEKRRHEAK